MRNQILILTLIILFSIISYAQTPEEAVNFLENESGIGARAQSMGNAYVGIADDYSAIHWNPAGLTQLKASEINGSLYHLQFKNEATFIGNTVLDDRSFTKLSSIGLAYKFPTTQGSFVVAFGYNRIKNYDDYLYFDGYSSTSNFLEFDPPDDLDEDIYYPFDNSVLRTEQITQEGYLSSWQLGGGIELSKNFSLGLTLNFYSGANQYAFSFYQDDVDNIYNEYPADFESYELNRKIDSEISGFGLKLGGLLRLNESLRLGFTIDFPTSLNITEIYSENDALIFDDGFVDEVDYGANQWEYVVTYPFKFSGGVSLDLKNLLLAASIEYRDWSQVEFDIPEGFSLDEDYSSLLDDNQLFPIMFRPVVSYAAGGEYRVSDTGINLRGGYRYVPSPLLDADEKLDHQYFTAGVGYDIDQNASLNLSLTKGFWKRNSLDSLTPNGTHEAIETTNLLAGISCRF